MRSTSGSPAVKSLLADLLAREGKIPFRMVTGEED